MRTRLSLLSKVRWDRKDSSVLEHCRMKETMKLRMPVPGSAGGTAKVYPLSVAYLGIAPSGEPSISLR